MMQSSECVFEEPDYVFKQLRVSQIHIDSEHPRKLLGIDEPDDGLLDSIKRIGLREDLAVVSDGADDYLIVDGQRRYTCARRLNIKTVICKVYPKLSRGDLEVLRFILQHRPRKSRHN